MKPMWMMIFLLLPLLGIAYIAWHVWCLLPCAWWWKLLAIALLTGSFLTMMFGMRGLYDSMPLSVGTALYEIGTSSIFVMMYLVILFLIFDLGRLIRLIPRTLLYNNWWTVLGITVVMTAVFIYGNLHYQHKYRQELTLTTSKHLTRPMKLVMVSDLHIGYHNPRKELHRWINMINAEKPDLVLIAGDIIDMSMRPLKEERMAEEFRRLTAPVYACLGNHEYYSGEPDAQQFYHDAGIHLLRDSAAAVGDLCIIGRDDRTNMHRKSLGRIVKENELLISHSSFLILLDHQPYHLEQAEQQHVDFQFSGHTHHGQVWPISWITDAVYECAFGEWQRGNTRYYVSSGLGIWGGKFRIGTRSEYIVATIKGDSAVRQK
jgi:predicted MPP superfamily phosphohydrolase